MKSAIVLALFALAGGRAPPAEKWLTYAVFGHLAPVFLSLVLLAACEAPPPQTAAAVPLQFSGSDACRECHAPEFALWRQSHHALAMQEATPDTVLGDFSGIDFRYFDQLSTFSRRDGKFVVRTDNAAGDPEDFIVSFTFGVTPLQQYLVKMPDGRVQALPVAWDARRREDGGQRWFHLYPDEFITHDHPLHWTGREQNWNNMCAECHSTDLQKNYDLSSNTFATTWAEISVGCEACHGPGSRHIARARESVRGGLVVDLDDSASWHINLDSGIAERSELATRLPRQPEACGRCHARRSVATDNYEFGKPLQDTHVPALLDPLLYFPDGQILDEVYVYGSFLQSRMYRAGVSCSDCHDPHSARLRTSGAPSEICNTCHLPQRFATAGHHRHEADVACVDCHMASRVYMGVDERRDHSFRVPRPDLTVSTGVPNACNRCHDDRDGRWAAETVNTWYGAGRDAHFAEAIHAGRGVSPAANKMLLQAIADDEFPGIARATALTLLRPPYAPDVIAALRGKLGDPDSLIRRAALSALSRAAPELILEWAAHLLQDPVRSVRIEAARIMSPLQASMPGEHLAAFKHANAERIAAQFAIAERPEAQLNLGNVYREAGRIDDAESAFLQALEFEPRAAAARVNLADLYAQTGRIGEAERSLREGIALADGDAVLHHALGLMLVRDNRHDAALPELELAARMQPQQSRFVYVYAIALNSLRRGEQAIAILEDASQRFPADFDIHFALATMLRDHGRVEEARQIARRLVEIYPHIDAAQNLLRSL